MFRRAFDVLMTAAGAALTIIMIVAGALLFWGYSFADNNVHDQLVQQRIEFPAASVLQKEPQAAKYLMQYAGQRLETGEQAYAYSEYYIKVHLADVAEGKTYSEVSTLSRANPSDTKLAGQVQTLFRGETLRGLLLNAYAFWQFGQLAKLGSIIAFSLAGVMALMTALGFWHVRRTSPRERFLAPPAAKRVRQVAVA